MRLTYLSIAAALSMLLTANIRAEESKAKETAKEVGHAVGSTAREIGHGTKKATKTVGKKVAEVARETGHAFRDGAKELKKAVAAESGNDSAAKK